MASWAHLLPAPLTPAPHRSPAGSHVHSAPSRRGCPLHTHAHREWGRGRGRSSPSEPAAWAPAPAPFGQDGPNEKTTWKLDHSSQENRPAWTSRGRVCANGARGTFVSFLCLEPVRHKRHQNLLGPRVQRPSGGSPTSGLTLISGAHEWHFVRQTSECHPRRQDLCGLRVFRGGASRGAQAGRGTRTHVLAGAGRGLGRTPRVPSRGWRGGHH